MKGSLDDKVQAQSLVDVVAARIEAAIISGTLEPGSRLSEQALATSLGVSRGPLREAIRRLEGRKLLQRTPNIGVRVAAFSLKDLNELLQVREALEGMAAALAAKNMTDAEIAALKKMLDQHESCVQEKAPYPDAKDSEFHFRIVAGSRNERLAQMLYEDVNYLGQVYRYKPSSKLGSGVKALQEHRTLVAALARRDSVAAEQKMREHFRKAWSFVEEQLLAAEAVSAAETPVLEGSKPGRAKERVRSLKPAIAE